MSRRSPLVVLNREVEGVPSVVTDNRAGARRAIEHLVELGHASVTYVAGPEASWADRQRWTAAREASIDLGVEVRRVGPFAPTVDTQPARDVAAAGELDGETGGRWCGGVVGTRSRPPARHPNELP
jgi:LacI family transcriptional regulator